MNTKELTNVVLKYCKNESPGYAIMIDGPWGIGKTHFIKELLDENNKLKAIHVSLYGAASTSQIDDSIFAALVGCADVSDSEIKKAGDFLGKMFSAFGEKTEGSAVGAIASISGEALKKRALKNLTSNTVLIFDDFERSKLPQNEALSKINEFVEHQKLKAIILCDERAVEDEKYYQTKEKVVLYTNAFHRSPDEIVSICFKDMRNLKGIHCDILEIELINIVEQFNLTNIRTIKHGLDCFKDIATEILKVDSKYQNSPILFEILFSTIVLSVAYKDYSVPVDELKKTVMNYSDMAVAYHMRKQSKEETKLTNWERFYVNILGQGKYRLEFESVFELVCKGHLDRAAIVKDLDRWEGKDSRPDSPISNFRVDQPISASEFQSYTDIAKDILNDRSYVFYSTAELYSFCKNLYFIYNHKGFNYDGNFNEKLREFATIAVNNCQSHTEPSAFGCRDDDSEVVKTIFALLSQSSKELSEAKIIASARKKLLSNLKKGGLERIVDTGDDAFSKNIINSSFVTSLTSIFPELDNVSVRALGIFLKNRFKSDYDFDNYKEELGPLLELDEYLKKYLKDSEYNLSTMMASILSNTVSSLVMKAEELAKTKK